MTLILRSRDAIDTGCAKDISSRSGNRGSRGRPGGHGKGEPGGHQDQEEGKTAMHHDVVETPGGYYDLLRSMEKGFSLKCLERRPNRGVSKSVEIGKVVAREL